MGIGMQGSKNVLSASSVARRNEDRLSSFLHCYPAAVEVHVLPSGRLVDTYCPNTKAHTSKAVIRSGLRNSMET